MLLSCWLAPAPTMFLASLLTALVNKSFKILCSPVDQAVPVLLLLAAFVVVTVGIFIGVEAAVVVGACCCCCIYRKVHNLPSAGAQVVPE